MNNIKAVRKQAGISVTELAAKLNMSQGNLSKIENNQIELKSDIAGKIAEALGVCVQAILTNTLATQGIKELTLLNPEALKLPPLSRLNIPEALLQTNEHQTALFVQQDDTMAPLIPSNALVLIDKSDKAVANGVFLIKINNIVYLRRLQTTFTEELRVLCDNPAYQPQQTNTSMVEIIGKAVARLSVTQL